MNKSSIILILVTFLINTTVSGVNAVSSKKARPVRDGFVLTGIDGKLISADSNEVSQKQTTRFPDSDGWFFKLDSDLKGDKGLIKAGSAIEILPSAELEKLANDMEERSANSYRLWGRITRYRGRNFIFPEHFLALSKARPAKSQVPQKPKQEPNKPTINEPNDVLTIPTEIIAKLRTRRTLQPEQPQKATGTQLKTQQDFILVNRTAVLVDSPDGYSLFVLDALGRNMQQRTLRLLPCQVLELTQAQQSAEPEQLQFKIAGRVTKYKGEFYMLPQRAIRVYGHGNFGK